MAFDRQSEGAQGQSGGTDPDETVCAAEYELRAFSNVQRYIVIMIMIQLLQLISKGATKGIKGKMKADDQGIKAKKNAVTAMNEIEEIDSLIILVVAQLSSELRFIVLVSSSMSAAYSVPNHRFWQWG